jgi:predicted nucleic acid-binding protein
MRILLDTNILLRIVQKNSPDHVAARSAVLSLAKTDIDLCLVPQVIYEFWAVATRPANVNGLGMAVAAADQSVQELIRDFLLLKDERGIFAHWQSLVVNHVIQGKASHDARLVAAMQRHGLTNLLTFNAGDFQRFQAINVLTPAEIVAGRIPRA